jgi:hypothetical protein
MKTWSDLLYTYILLAIFPSYFFFYILHASKYVVENKEVKEVKEGRKEGS